MKYLIFFIFSAHFSLYLLTEFLNSEKNLQPASGMDAFGDMHGEVAVDSEGLIYLSVSKRKKTGVQIFFLRMASI